jgi:hypothetical protein
MLKINLRGQIRQTALPKWKPLLPLFEAMMNAFQAVQDAPKDAAHKIIVEIEREHDLDLGDEPPVSGFKVTDTGVGFNDDNFDSFNTSFSDYKIARGGKGLGRFIWRKLLIGSKSIAYSPILARKKCYSASLRSTLTMIPMLRYLGPQIEARSARFSSW